MATLSVAARNAALDAIVALLETGVVFTGITIIITNAALGTLMQAALPSPAFAAAASGRASLLSSVDLAFNGTGTPAFLTVRSRANTNVFTGSTIGDPGSGADMEMSPSVIAVVIGQLLRVSVLDLEIA